VILIVLTRNPKQSLFLLGYRNLHSYFSDEVVETGSSKGEGIDVSQLVRVLVPYTALRVVRSRDEGF
jgi:hypothetical protein